jgi:hypothetical protein
VTRVLVYSQLFPFPPQHGAHHRILQLIRYFLSRGCDVHLLCHSRTWGNRFDRGAVDLAMKAHLIRFPAWGYRVDAAWRRLFQPQEHSIVSKLAYNRFLRKLAPDIVLMNYVTSMGLLPQRVGAAVIVDTHDFLSLSRHLSIRARALLAEQRYDFSSPEAVIEEFMRASADEVSQEVSALAKSDLILAISKEEAKIFQERTRGQVQVLNYRAEEPESRAPVCPNELGLMPVGTGDNPHNILGAYCIDRAMRALGSTKAVVAAVGHAARELRVGAWCESLGHVADYFDAVRRHGFGVCPAFWGTGAQIKQYEFAELGAPIVAYRWMVDSELWIDGENCLLTENPGGFADRLCSLGAPRVLVRLREQAKLLSQRMGERLARQLAELDQRLGLVPLPQRNFG